MSELKRNLQQSLGRYFPLAIVVVAAVVFLLVNPFVQVDRGEVEVLFNQYSGNTSKLGPGTHIVMPFVFSKTTYPTQTQKFQLKAEASTSDLQSIRIDITLNYSLRSNLTPALHQEVGEDYENLIIYPMLQESIKAATANFKITELITQRPKLKREIQKNLQLNARKLVISKRIADGADLTVEIPKDPKDPNGPKKTVKVNPNNLRHIKAVKSVPNYFVMENVSIENVKFSDQYAAAVERKERQKQDNATAELKEQESAFEKARQKNLDDAKAYSQKVLSQTATKQSIQLRWIEKWDGKLPNTMAGGQTDLILGLQK